MTDMLRVVDRRPDGLDREDAAGPRSRSDDHDLLAAHRRARDLAADALARGRSRRTRGSRRSTAARAARAGASTRTLIRRPTATSTTPTAPRTGFGTSCHDYLLKGDEPERSSCRAAALPLGRALRHVGHARAWWTRSATSAWWLHSRDRPVGHGGRGARARQPLDGHLRPAAVRARPDAVLHRLAARASTRSSARPASTRSR